MTRPEADAPGAASPASVAGRTRDAPPSWRWVRPAMRTSAVVQATLTLLQAVLAGHLLTGQTTARAWHGTLGTEVISWLAAAQLVLALLLWRPARGPAWPIPVAAALIGVLALQSLWGFDGRLALHVPVGVGFLVVQLLLAAGLRDRADGAS